MTSAPITHSNVIVVHSVRKPGRLLTVLPAASMTSKTAPTVIVQKMAKPPSLMTTIFASAGEAASGDILASYFSDGTP